MTETQDSGLDNPAARLFALLSRIRAESENLAPLEIWASVLRAPSSSPEDVAPLFLAACRLPDLVVQAFEGLDVDSEPYLRYIGDARKVLYWNAINQPWRNKNEAVSQSLMYSLEMASIELRRHHTDDAIAEEEIAELMRLAHELRESVLTAELDPGFKEFVSRSLDSIDRGFVLYRIYGPEALAQAIYPCVGEVVLRREQVTADAFEEHMGKLTSLLGMIYNAAQKAVKLKELAGQAFPSILGPQA